MVAFGAIEGPVGALRQPSTNPYREGGRSLVAGCFAAPYQGLSPVPGNLHAGFLGDCALEAHEIQQPEMAALVKPSQRPGTESCVVNR